MARLNAGGFSGDMLESTSGSQDRKRGVPGRKQVVTQARPEVRVGVCLGGQTEGKDS